MSSVPAFGTFRTTGTFRTLQTPRNSVPAQLSSAQPAASTASAPGAVPLPRL